MDLKIYTVNDDYIERLHDVDDKVLQGHPGAKSRKFICILITINQKQYCVPFSSPDDSDYIFKNGRRTCRRSFFPVILRMFVEENNGRSFVGKLLFNNMIPVNPSVITEYDLDNEPDISYKNLVIKQFTLIRSLYRRGVINRHADKIYEEKLNGLDKGYVKATVDFKKLEKVCDEWSSTQVEANLVAG